MNEASESELLDRLAHDFLQRYRRGERPSLTEYTARYQQVSEKIRELFPTLVLMENAAEDDASSASQIGTSPPLPDRIGDFRILRALGAGGMGVVYEAEQVSLGRHVALKVLPIRPGQDPVLAQRFQHEARAAARLNHDHIVPVYDVGQQSGVLFYAMQFIRGESIHAYHRGIARLGVHAAEALAYAHAEGIIHRDVKPSNLLLDTSGKIWVVDFGLAKVAGDDLTASDNVVGTLRYMPPERFRGWSDPRSDVYGLGLTLYEMLALRPAHDVSDRIELMREITQVPPRRIRDVDARIPRPLETIVDKAIHKEPGRRYQSALELADDLQRWLDGKPIRAHRLSCRHHTWQWCRRQPYLAASSMGESHESPLRLF